MRYWWEVDMKQATLCLLIRENKDKRELLLALKKRGFGYGKWNGFGGKQDPEKGDKDLIDTAIRETEEEVGVKIKKFEKVAILSFYFPYILKKEWDQDVHVFLVEDWEGEPMESEEMLPRWFAIEEIPFEQMWDDDKLWLPQILKGRKLKANFIFKEGEIILKHDIEIVEKLH